MVDSALPVAGYAKRFTAFANSSKTNLSFVKSISDRLAHAIRHSGQSKGALAAHIGVPQSSVSRWLAGSEPRSDRLAEIAKFLSVDVNWLMTGRGNAESSISPKERGVGESAHPAYAEDDDQRRSQTAATVDYTALLTRIAEALEELVENQRQGK